MKRKVNKWKGEPKYRKSTRAYNYKPSKGEERVSGALEKLQLSFIVEAEFRSLKGHYFDFWIPSKRVMIEFDGMQHFTAKNIFDKGDSDLFEARKEKDNEKNRFCKLHDIKLIRIPYNHKKTVRELIIKGLATKAVSHGVYKTELGVKGAAKQKRSDKDLIKRRMKKVVEQEHKATTLIDGKVYYRKLRRV